MSRSGQVVVALLVGAAILVGMTWFDSGVLAAERAKAQANSDIGSFAAWWSLGALALAAAVLSLGALAWWSRSAVVGAVFVVLGVLFASIPIVVLRPAAPAPDFLDSLFLGMGPMNAIILLGATMLVAGVAAIWRDVQGRRTTPAAPANLSRGRSARPR